LVPVVGLRRIIPSNTGPSAHIYYLSPVGNDQNSGISADAAWASFDRAWRDLYPGDTLVLLDGIYRQTLQPNQRNAKNIKLTGVTALRGL
jgi:hypothetical protein